MSETPSPKDWANLLAKLAILDERIVSIQERQNKMATQVEALTAQANRWRGGFMVILGLGGFIGWVADRVLKGF